MSRFVEFVPAVGAEARTALLASLDGGARTIKSSPGRIVRRIAAPLPAVVKHYRIRGLLPAIRALFRNSPARREFRTSLDLASRALPVVRALALVEERFGPFVREARTVLEDLGEAKTLADALRGKDRLARRPLLEGAGRLAADLHALGFSHGDLHAGNFFLRPDGSLALGDLPRVRRARATLGARARDLAFLLYSLRGLDAVERARLLRSYAARAGLRFDLLAREAATRASRRGLRRSVGAYRRAFEAIYGRARFSTPGWDGIVYPERAAAIPSLLAVTTDAHPGEWRRIVHPPGTIWIRALRRGEARRAWGEVHRCAALALPTAQPIAWLEARRPPRSVLAVAAPDRCWPLPTVLRHARRRARAGLMGVLGRLARRAHEAGLRLRDVSPHALLVEEEGDPPRAFVGAPLGLAAGSPLEGSERRADLEAFAREILPHLSRADRVRSLRAYDPFGHLFRRGARPSAP